MDGVGGSQGQSIDHVVVLVKQLCDLRLRYSGISFRLFLERSYIRRFKTANEHMKSKIFVLCDGLLPSTIDKTNTTVLY